MLGRRVIMPRNRSVDAHPHPIGVARRRRLNGQDLRDQGRKVRFERLRRQPRHDDRGRLRFVGAVVFVFVDKRDSRRWLELKWRARERRR